MQKELQVKKTHVNYKQLWALAMSRNQAKLFNLESKIQLSGTSWNIPISLPEHFNLQHSKLIVQKNKQKKAHSQRKASVKCWHQINVLNSFRLLWTTNGSAEIKFFKKQWIINLETRVRNTMENRDVNWTPILRVLCPPLLSPTSTPGPARNPLLGDCSTSSTLLPPLPMLVPLLRATIPLSQGKSTPLQGPTEPSLPPGLLVRIPLAPYSGRHWTPTTHCIILISLFPLLMPSG